MDKGGVGSSPGSGSCCSRSFPVGVRPNPGDVISGHAGPGRCPAAGILPRRAGTWQKPRPAGRFPPPCAGPVVWIRTIDSRGSIGILFEFVEPGGYSKTWLPGEFSRDCEKWFAQRVPDLVREFIAKEFLDLLLRSNMVFYNLIHIPVQRTTDFVPRTRFTQPGQGRRGTWRTRHRYSVSRALCPKYPPAGRGLPAQAASQSHRSSPSPPHPT